MAGNCLFLWATDVGLDEASLLLNLFQSNHMFIQFVFSALLPIVNFLSPNFYSCYCPSKLEMYFCGAS